jgi:hypothetical protein
VTGLWFSPGTLVSSTNKTDSHDITEILFSGVTHNSNPLYISGKLITVNTQINAMFGLT